MNSKNKVKIYKKDPTLRFLSYFLATVFIGFILSVVYQPNLVYLSLLIGMFISILMSLVSPFRSKTLYAEIRDVLDSEYIENVLLVEKSFGTHYIRVKIKKESYNEFKNIVITDSEKYIAESKSNKGHTIIDIYLRDYITENKPQELTMKLLDENHAVIDEQSIKIKYHDVKEKIGLIYQK